MRGAEAEPVDVGSGDVPAGEAFELIEVEAVEEIGGAFGSGVETEGHADDGAAVLRGQAPFVTVVAEILTGHGHVAGPGGAFDGEGDTSFAIVELVRDGGVLNSSGFDFGCGRIGTIICAGGGAEERKECDEGYCAWVMLEGIVEGIYGGVSDG